MNAARRIGIFVAIFFVFTLFAKTDVLAQQPDYSKIRLKIFHLLNLVPGPPPENPPSPTTPGSPNPGPGAPLATPTPTVKRTIITYKGSQVGQAQYEASSGYQMTAEIPEQISQNFDYYVWLKRTSPENIIRLNDAPLTSFRISYVNSQDLTGYSELIITEEPTNSAPPTVPTNSKYAATQTPITPTSGPVPTQSTTPTGSGSTPTGSQPTTNPTSGQGPPVAQQIQDVIAAISETKIQEYLTAIANKEGQNDETQTRFSATQGNLDEQAYLIKHFQDLGYEVDTTQEYSYSYRGNQITTKNIIARLNGQDTSSFYLMTAHMDSTAERDGSTDPAPGVNDNGSGTVSVMEVARAFKQANIQPQHSVEFILFSGEEQGLHGSTNYVSRLASSKKIRAVLNLDMVGNKDPQGDCVNFYFKPGTGGNLISDALVQVATDANIGLKTESAAWGITASDHAPFWNAGIHTAIFGHECNKGTATSRYHSTSDKIEGVSVSQIAKAAKAAGGALVKMSQEGIGQQVNNELNAMMMQQLSAGINYDPRYTLIPNMANSFESRLAEIRSKQQSNSASGLVGQAQAAEDGVILAIIPFKDLSEIDFLYANVSTSIDYLMGKEIPQPLFLGLFSQEQLGALESKGYEPQIIDENTDLRQYVFLYHPQPNQGDKLLTQGEVFEVAPNYFLLKLAPGVVHSHEGVLGEFFDLTLPQNTAPPPYRSVRITLAPTPSSAEVSEQADADEERGSGLLVPLLLIGLLFLIVVGVVLFILIRRKQNSIPETS